MGQQTCITFDSVTVAQAIAERKGKRGARISGICRDAKAIGVSRQHLWSVLKGRRVSRPLLLRYEALKSEQAKAASATDTTDKSKE